MYVYNCIYILSMKWNPQQHTEAVDVFLVHFQRPLNDFGVSRSGKLWLIYGLYIYIYLYWVSIWLIYG